MNQILEKNGLTAARGDIAVLPRIAAAELRERFDRGGWMPEEQAVPAALFLLEYARRTGEGWAGSLAEAALERMDRKGGGLLAYALLEAYAQTGLPACREGAWDLLDGALKKERMPGGGFEADGTVHTLWNAWMIAALAKAYRVLGEDACLGAARDARLFLKTRLTQDGGLLRRRWRDRQPLEEGRLADYGAYCWALLELYAAGFSVSCLREAEAVADRMTARFRDWRGGLSGSGGGEGLAGAVLVRLGEVTSVERYRGLAMEQLSGLAGRRRTELDGFALLGMVEALHPRQGLVCASAGGTPAWLAPVGEEYRLAALAKTPENSRGLANAAPFTGAFPLPAEGERLYLCRDGVGVETAEDLLQLCRRLSPEGAPV